MQEHFIRFIHGDVPFEAVEREALKYGPVGKVLVGWKKDTRNVRAEKVMEGMSRDELVKLLTLSVGVSGIMISRIIGRLNRGIRQLQPWVDC